MPSEAEAAAIADHARGSGSLSPMTHRTFPTSPPRADAVVPAFRGATLEDIDGVLALMAIFYREDGYPFDATELRSAIIHLLTHPELGRLWVLAAPDRICGYVFVTLAFSLEFGGRAAVVDDLFLAEDVRGHGYGRAALDIAEGYSRELGVGSIHLAVEPHRQRAHELYLRYGFVEHSRRLMTKRL